MKLIVCTGVMELRTDFGFGEHQEAILRAWEAGLVDPYFDHWKRVEKRLGSGAFDESTDLRYRFFRDTADSMARWYCFQEGAGVRNEIQKMLWVAAALPMPEWWGALTVVPTERFIRAGSPCPKVRRS